MYMSISCLKIFEAPFPKQKWNDAPDIVLEYTGIPPIYGQIQWGKT